MYSDKFTSSNVVTRSSGSPVSIETVRYQLRNEDLDFDDDYLQILIDSAVEAIEKKYSISLLNKEVEDFFSGAENVTMLRVYPVNQILQVHALQSGHYVEVSDSTYRLSKKNDRGAVIFTSPVSSDSGIDVIKIRYRAGFGITDHEVPKPIVQAILLIISDWYENRENPIRSLPTAADKLLEPYYPYS